MKKVLFAGFAAIIMSTTTLADSYLVGQQVIAPQFAINLATIGNAAKVVQVAQNVGNVASIKDLDIYGGDSFTTGQQVTAMQFAKNDLTVSGAVFPGKVDQTAINFGSDLTIKDVGGLILGPQTVFSLQSQSGMQHAINTLDTFGSPTVIQLAANVANTMSIDLPSTASINSVTTGQQVVAPQVAGNFVNLTAVTTLTQTAANAGNQVSINQ